MAAVHIEDYACEEGIVAQIVNEDVGNRGSKVADDIAHEVVGQWARHSHFLQFQSDGISLIRPYPDRQIALGIHLFEDHHAVLSDQAHSYAFDLALYHKGLHLAGT